MADRVVDPVGSKFTLDFVLGAACSVSQRVTALYHKPVHNAVEGQPVIKPVFSQLDKVFHCDRCRAFIQLQLDRPVILNGDLRMADFRKRFNGCLCALGSRLRALRSLRLSAPAQGQDHRKHHSQENGFSYRIISNQFKSSPSEFAILSYHSFGGRTTFHFRYSSIIWRILACGFVRSSSDPPWCLWSIIAAT